MIIAAFVVLIFGLYVDGKLGQEGALGRQRTGRETVRTDASQLMGVMEVRETVLSCC